MGEQTGVPDEPGFDVYTIEGVNGGAVTILFHGEVIIMHSSNGEETVYTDELFGLSADGKPVELTRESALGIAALIVMRLKADAQD